MKISTDEIKIPTQEETAKIYNSLYQNFLTALPRLEDKIEEAIGYRIKLETELFIEISGNSAMIKICSKDIIDSLKNTPMIGVLSKINLDFWYGNIKFTNHEMNCAYIPHISYEHIGGGSNSASFIWRSLWFDFKTNHWNAIKIGGFDSESF